VAERLVGVELQNNVIGRWGRISDNNVNNISGGGYED
jgi:hypothetical protein